MNFLSPWFLAAGLLVAGPIIAHLIRRVTRERVVFSATRFLEASRPRLQRHHRIQHPLLLALRCLVVALLAAAFARPFFRGNAGPAAIAEVTQDVVILLDESASMRRSGLWNEARARAVRTVETLRAGDRCSVLVASSSVTPLMTIEEWVQTPPGERAGRVRALLAAKEPGWGPFFLDTAVDSALELFADAAHGTAARQRLVVISDFASGTRTAGLAGRDWPPGCEVNLERTSPRIENNAGLQFLGWDERSGVATRARLRVTRDQGAPALRLTLSLRSVASERDIGPPQTLELGSGQTQLSLLPVPEGDSGPFEAVLKGDAQTFDNRVWLVPPAPRVATVAHVGRAESTDPDHAPFYVTRALSSAPGIALSVASIDPRGSAEAAKTAPLIVVTEPPSERLTAEIKKRVEEGAFAIVTASSPELVQTAAALAGESGWAASAAGKGYALLGKIDFTHPLFSLFADPRFSDFSHLRFWHPQPIQLPVNSATQVVARFDDDAPAVLETSAGRGRVITWGGDWSPAASQWVLSTKFVPWLQSLLERASGGPTRPAYAEIGDVSRLTRDPAAQWRAASAPSESFSRTPPTVPGLYQLRDYDSTRWVALEVPAEESRTDALPLDTFEQLGVPVKAKAFSPATASAHAPVDSAAVEIEGRQKLWRWLLMGAAALLALESLASFTVGKRGPSEESA